jgi:hypothetical protein
MNPTGSPRNLAAPGSPTPAPFAPLSTNRLGKIFHSTKTGSVAIDEGGNLTLQFNFAGKFFFFFFFFLEIFFFTIFYHRKL